MQVLGGRRPSELPRWLAANAQRVEMLWSGQSQAPSWLTQAGWAAPVGAEAWSCLGRQPQSGQTAVQPREGAE